MTEGMKALLAAILAFSAWGLFPLYWKLFPELSGESLFMQRLFWSLITLTLISAFTGRWQALLEIFKDKRRWWLLLSAFLIASNWLIYVAAVTEGHILEASMGYFLNPLINVVVGWLFLKETLRRTQWPAVILAIVGVVWMGVTADFSAFPWIAVSLALTFALYGVIRKLTNVGPIVGLTYETAVVFLPFLLWWYLRNGELINDLVKLSPSKFFLLSLSGTITCLPLILFAYASRRLPLQTLGFTQYLSPTLKFLCGWLVFNESLSAVRLQGFLFIWAGLAWYTAEQLVRYKGKTTQIVSVPSPD